MGKPSDAEKLASIDARKVFIHDALQNPLVLGLAALAANRVAYAAGLYQQLPGEKEVSALGGPVWFRLPGALPLDQERYQKIELFIVTTTVAWAASRALSGAVPSISKLIEAAA